MAILTALVEMSTKVQTDLVTASSGKIIRVTGVFITAAGTSTVQFKSAGDSDRTGEMPISVGSPIMACKDGGLFETGVGDRLTLDNGAAVAIGGWITYELAGF